MTDKFERLDSFGWIINVLASQATKKLDQELKPYGITASLWPTLMCLWEEEGVTQREIAKKSQVENSTTTRTLDKLEKLGLVKRQQDPNSRRSFHIYLTKEGRLLKDLVQPIPVAINDSMQSALNDAEQKELLSLLRKILENK